MFLCFTFPLLCSSVCRRGRLVAGQRMRLGDDRRLRGEHAADVRKWRHRVDISASYPQANVFTARPSSAMWGMLVATLASSHGDVNRVGFLPLIIYLALVDGGMSDMAQHMRALFVAWLCLRFHRCVTFLILEPSWAALHKMYAQW